MGPIVLGVIAAIAFGTLYPFQHNCPGSLAAAFAHFKPLWPPSSGRGDILANLVLYIPLGLAVVAWLERRPAALRLGVAIVLGLGLSLTLELIQACETARVSSWSDLFLNGVGVTLGAAGGIIAGRWWAGPLGGLARGDVGAALLLLLFAGWRLAPYVPSIDWQQWKNALKPLLSPEAPPLEVLRFAVLWLALARLIAAALPVRRTELAFLGFLLVYLALRVVTIRVVLVPAELAGAGLAVIAMLALGRRIPDLALAGLLAAVIAHVGLQPWQLGAEAAPFCWVPFCGFLQGSLLVNVVSMAEKLFLYGALIWFLARGGIAHRLAGIATAVPLLALELAQTRLPGRLAEITDPLLALIIAEVLRQLDRRTPLSGRR